MSHNLVQLRRNRGDVGVQDNALQQLKHVMHERRVITTGDVAAVARSTGQPEASVFGVATYYGDLGTKRTRPHAREGLQGHRVPRGLRRRLGRLDGGGARSPGRTRPAPTARSRSRPSTASASATRAPPSRSRARIYGELTPERAKALAKELKSGGGLAEAHDALVPRFEVHGGPAIVLERLVLADRRHRPRRRAGARRLRGPREGARVDGAGSGARRDRRLAAPRSRRRGLPRRPRSGASQRSTPQTTGEAYVVCNADEGDPGSYIDKYLMERDPFAVLEGHRARGLRDRRAARLRLRALASIRSSAPALKRAVLAARAAGLLGNEDPRQRLLVRHRDRRGRRLVRLRRGDGAAPLARGPPRDGHGTSAVSGRQGPLRAARPS